MKCVLKSKRKYVYIIKMFTSENTQKKVYEFQQKNVEYDALQQKKKWEM